MRNVTHRYTTLFLSLVITAGGATLTTGARTAGTNAKPAKAAKSPELSPRAQQQSEYEAMLKKRAEEAARVHTPPRPKPFRRPKRNRTDPACGLSGRVGII